MRGPKGLKVAVAGAAATVAAIGLWPRLEAKWWRFKYLIGPQEVYPHNSAESAVIWSAAGLPREVLWSDIENFGPNEIAGIESSTFWGMRSRNPGDSTLARRWANHLPAMSLVQAIIQDKISWQQIASYIVLIMANPEAFVADHGFALKYAVITGLKRLTHDELLLVRAALEQECLPLAVYDELLKPQMVG